MQARRLAVVATVLLLAYSRLADAEPAPIPEIVPTGTISPVDDQPDPIGKTLVQTEIERWLCAPAVPVERCLRLPAGRFIDEDSWQRMDRETRRLQEVETRITAENKSYEKTARSWQPGWKVLTATFVVGLVAGAYAFEKL
jgi:hypothetical protein